MNFISSHVFLDAVGFSLRIRLLLNLIFAGICSFSFPTEAAEALFTRREKFCLIAHSVRTQSEVVALSREAIEKLLGRPCDEFGEPVSNPFATEVRKKIAESFGSKILLVWMDEKSRDGEFLLRLIYLRPFLQLSMLKEKLPAGFYAESASSKADIVAGRLRRLVEELPYQGYVDADGFAVWQSADPMEPVIEKFSAHGLLPILVEWTGTPWLNAKVTSQADASLKIVYPDRERLKFPLWLRKSLR